MTPSHWMVAALLLFIGAMMIADPAGCSGIPRNVAIGLRSFERRTFSSRTLWKMQRLSRMDLRVSGEDTMKLRIIGLGFIVLGMTVVVVS